MGVEQEIKIITRAYAQAQQGLQATAQGITQVSRAADQATASSQRLNQAFGAAMKQADGYKQAANGLYLPISRVAEAEQKVTAQSHQMGQAVGQAGKHIHGMGGHAHGARDAVQDFYQTLGMLGFIAGFQQAVTGLINTYREFNATITQSSMIAEDHTGALERQAMAATRGMYGPQELTSVYRDLGSAGLNARDVIAATTPTIQFATAAMIDQSDAAQAVIAAASSFNIPFSQADKITNAFAEAMNRTTLGGRDLVYALASIGPVAGMAGQGLGQTLGAVAALRNAGAHAQDAATSVRAAMLHMANPSDEARDAMKALNISVYDAQGRMKQWSEIVAEFERALAPYNQQTRQMALTTILGSDGIRAMAASMQYGSGRLTELAGQFENAEGSASRMAGTMEETLDGAIRRVNGNLERAAIIMGDDMEPAITSVIGFLDKLVNGFLHLDETTRKLIELILGGAGLAVALTSVAGVIKMLSPSIVGIAGSLNMLGGAIKTVTVAGKALTIGLGGVLGIVGLVAAALGLAYGAWRSYQAGQEQATLAGADNARKLGDQRDRLRELSGELEDLAAKTNPTNEEQARLKQIAGEISKIAPEAASGINQMTGEVENLGKVLQGTSSAMERLLGQSNILARGAMVAAQGKLPGLEAEQAKINAQIDEWTKAINAGPEAMAKKLGRMFDVAPGADPLTAMLVSSPEELSRDAAAQVAKLVEQSLKLQAEITELRATAETAKSVLNSGFDRPATRSEADAQASDRPANAKPRTGGGKDGTNLFGSGDKPTWISQWKSGLEATMATLAPFEQALGAVSGQMDILDAKQAYYLDLLADGKGGVEALMGAENARVEIIRSLEKHQEALHSANEANRAMVQSLAAEQRKLDSQLAAGTITSKDHQEASATLRKETEQLTDAIYQNSAAWWRDEQAIANAEAAAGKAQRTLREAQQKLNDQAYQNATGAMRHEVAMKRLSVDQQITLIRQMLSEMTLSGEQAGALQEQLVGLYGQKMETEMQRVQDAYSDAMDAVSEDLEAKLNSIQTKLEETIGPLKQQLKDLEAEESKTDRDRAKTDHEKRLADIDKERKKHQWRLGKEHKEALARLDQEAAEENLRWQRQQDDWNLDDRKRAIEDKIQTAEDGAKDEREKAQDAAKKQREDLEDHYKEVKRITESGILDSIAALAATNPQWFETGKGLIDNLISGLETGDFSSILSQISSIKSAAEEAAAAAMRLAQMQFAPTPPQVTGGGTGGGRSGNSSGGHYAFATGAWEIPYDGLQAVLHRGETVLPAYAATAFRNFAANMGSMDRLLGAVQDLARAVLARPAGDVRVYGAENQYVDDPTDAALVSRETAREVSRVLGVTG